MKLPHNRRTAAALVVSGAFLVPLAVFGAPALARSTSPDRQQSGSAQYQYKVTICHHTHSAKHPWVKIRVGAPGARAHLKHHNGDFIVTASAPCPPTTAATAPTTKHHGNGKGNGNGNGHASSSDNGASGEHGQSDNGHGKGHGK